MASVITSGRTHLVTAGTSLPLLFPSTLSHLLPTHLSTHHWGAQWNHGSAQMISNPKKPCFYFTRWQFNNIFGNDRTPHPGKDFWRECNSAHTWTFQKNKLTGPLAKQESPWSVWLFQTGKSRRLPSVREYLPKTLWKWIAKSPITQIQWDLCNTFLVLLHS